MKRNLQISFLVLALVCFGVNHASLAQSINSTQKPTGVKSDGRILYNNGRVMVGASNLYLVWYGCWDNNCGPVGDTGTQSILSDFSVNVGSSPYFQVLAGYPNGYGQGPSGALLVGGSAIDRYSHGLELTASDLQSIVADQITGLRL